jgi:hypothetical protein
MVLKQMGSVPAASEEKAHKLVLVEVEAEIAAKLC